MKLCKDCKHYYDGYVYIRGIPVPIIEGACAYLAKNRDPVDGTVMDKGELMDCREYRAEISHIENKCGPEANHFQHRYFTE